MRIVRALLFLEPGKLHVEKADQLLDCLLVVQIGEGELEQVSSLVGPLPAGYVHAEVEVGFLPFASRPCTSESSSKTTSLKEGDSGKASSTPSQVRIPSSAFSLRSRACSSDSFIPFSPFASRLAPASVARKAWLEQTLEVAFSLRICCSLVESTMTKQSLPLTSLALPT